jgi:hypothetical protein
MSKKDVPSVSATEVKGSDDSIAVTRHADDVKLAELGYKVKALGKLLCL